MDKLKNWVKNNQNQVVAIVVTAIVVVFAVIYALTSSSGGSSKKSWGDLNETEKNNARWAYYAQEAAKNYDN